MQRRGMDFQVGNPVALGVNRIQQRAQSDIGIFQAGFDAVGRRCVQRANQGTGSLNPRLDPNGCEQFASGRRFGRPSPETRR